MRKSKNPKRAAPNVVAIIPARGGTQSTPYKNLLKLSGKPLLWWAIDVALKAKTIDAVVVSTEDPWIARVARRYGALVAPRPKEFSQPNSDDSGWYRHAVQWMKETYGWEPELLVNLRPTGPLRTPEDVDACVHHVLLTDCDGLKTVIPTPIPPYKMWTMRKDGSLRPLLPHPYRLKHGPDIPRQRAQKKFPVYWQDAQIDITRPKFVFGEAAHKYGNCFGPNIHGYVMDERKVVDIDTPEDLRHAAAVLGELQKESRPKARRPRSSMKFQSKKKIAPL
jgi:N-acylneuraminate cytidylyltransferase